jgi:hypothetical protein
MQWPPKFDGALGQDHPALCRNEERIAEGVAKPRQPGRQGGLAQVQTPGGTRDVPFCQEGFERDEQAEIEASGIHAMDNIRHKVRFQPWRSTKYHAKRPSALGSPIDNMDSRWVDALSHRSACRL